MRFFAKGRVRGAVGLSLAFIGAAGCSNVEGADLASAACNEPPSDLLTEVRFAQQEATNWCWAAVGEMVMSFHGANHLQCEQAFAKTGLNECQCANSPAEIAACNVTSWPVIDDFAFGWECNYHDPLTWPKIRDELSCKRQPFMFTWKWTEHPGSHMMVAVGHRLDPVAGTRFVSHLDPASSCSEGSTSTECVGDYMETTYEFFREAEGHHTHSRTYYDVHGGGSGAWSFSSWVKCGVL